MKIAIMVSGLPRFCREFDDLLTNLTGYTQVDWFFHLWNDYQDPYVHPKWTMYTVDQTREKILNNLPANHHIAYLNLQPLPEYPHNDRPFNRVPWGNPPRIWWNFLGIKLANRAREEYEKINGMYDLVIKNRPDAGITPLNCIIAKHTLDQYPNTLLTSANGRTGLGGRSVSDLVIIGCSKKMSIYANCFDHILSYNDQGLPFHAETLLSEHMIRNHIETPMTTFNCILRQYKLENGEVDYGRW
jgi:hypothetical protein